MSRAVHFEIHVEEPGRAKSFHEKVFGWTITKWDNPAWEYWLISTGPKDAHGVADLHDTEGNILGLTQPDLSAK